MRPALSLFGYALTALRGVEATFDITYASAANIKTTAAGTRLIPVLVGGASLAFTPNSVTANPGDVIQFQFAARNHTVTQSDQSSPCQPLSAAAATGAAGASGSSSAQAAAGVNSGFIAFDNGASGFVGTFDMPVTSSKPMFLYCAQATHCQSGMVMVINGQSSDLISYANSATAAKANTPAKQVAGGAVASIPLSAALVPLASSTSAAGSTRPAATTSSSSSSQEQQSTQTVTRSNTNAAATATVTRAPSRVGGGTATATATTVVVVGPSGIAAASATGGGGGGSGANRNNGTGLGAAGNTPAAAAVFTGGAPGALAGGWQGGGSLVSAGAAALGSLLFAAGW